MAALISLTYNCGAKILQNRGRPFANRSVDQRRRFGRKPVPRFLRKAYSRKGFNNGLAVRRCMEVLYAKKNF